MHWPGAGLSARSDPRAVAETVLQAADHEEGSTGSAP